MQEMVATILISTYKDHLYYIKVLNAPLLPSARKNRIPVAQEKKVGYLTDRSRKTWRR